MVDVGAKSVSRRTARARSVVALGPDIMQHLTRSGLTGSDIQTRKGPVFQTAIIAGTMAAKRTDDLIPLCHSLGLDNCQITITAEGSDAVIDCFVDAFDWPGPLNGILSAFGRDPASAWLVVACDMPLLTWRSFDALVNGRNLAKLATVFYDSDGQLPEPLLGIYEPAFGPIMESAVAGGHYSPRRLLQQNDVELLTTPDVRELTNVNDPASRTRLGF